MMEQAPFHIEIAQGPEHGVAYWITSEDELRLRVAVWQAQGETKGTILLFPGRTEYIELQGRTARDFAVQGYTVFTIDWRGHGMSDRIASDPNALHVNRYSDYQRDVWAMVQAAHDLKLPRPWFLFGNSMGGCIGLRAIIEGLDVAACAFSAPMWSIKMSNVQRVIAIPVTWAACVLGKGQAYVPGHTNENYALSNPFEGNRMTCDPDYYNYWVNQAHAQPSLQTAGSSMRWLHESLLECRRLSNLDPPDIPGVAFWGDCDALVDFEPIAARMSTWKNGTVERIENAKHALFLEKPETRRILLTKTDQLFSSVG